MYMCVCQQIWNCTHTLGLPPTIPVSPGAAKTQSTGHKKQSPTQQGLGWVCILFLSCAPPTHACSSWCYLPGKHLQSLLLFMVDSHPYHRLSGALQGDNTSTSVFLSHIRVPSNHSSRSIFLCQYSHGNKKIWELPWKLHIGVTMREKHSGLQQKHLRI